MRTSRRPTRTGAPRRRVVVATLVMAVIAGLAGAGASGLTAADAVVTTPGSAMAKSAVTVPGSGVTLTPSGSGALGTLTAPLAGVVSAAAALPNTLLTVASTALTSTAGLQAVNAAVRQPRPTPVNNYPDCNQAGWVSPNGNCFAVVPTTPTPTPTLGANALLALSAGAVQGYATGDDLGYVAAAGSAHPVLVVPGLALDLGVASSDVPCGTMTCTVEHAFTGASLTTAAGTVPFSLASAGSLAKVGTTTIASGTTVPIVANAISATANGNFLTFNVTLSLTQFLGVLGTTLSALNSGLTGLLADNGSSITLGVTVGPGDVTPTGAATGSAWGLEVGLNLVATIKLSLTSIVGGLLGSLIGTTQLTTGASNYPTAAGSTPNLLDLKLAYSQGAAGALLPDYIPAGLI